MNYSCQCCPVYERMLQTGWYVGDKAHEVMPGYDMQHGPRCEESTDTSDEEDEEMPHNECNVVKSQATPQDHEFGLFSNTNTHTHSNYRGKRVANQVYGITTHKKMAKLEIDEKRKTSKGDTNSNGSKHSWEDYGKKLYLEKEHKSGWQTWKCAQWGENGWKHEDGWSRNEWRTNIVRYPVEVQKGYQYNLQHKDGIPDTYENIIQKAEDLRQVHEDLQGIYKAFGAIIKKHAQMAEKNKTGKTKCR